MHSIHIISFSPNFKIQASSVIYKRINTTFIYYYDWCYLRSRKNIFKVDAKVKISMEDLVKLDDRE